MQYLFDEKGKRYLDAFAGIVTVSVGHCHPKVVQPIVDQLQRVQHTTTIYLNEQIALFGKELADVMPGKLKVVWAASENMRLCALPFQVFLLLAYAFALSVIQAKSRVIAECVLREFGQRGE